MSGLCVVGVLTFCCSTLCKSEGGGDADHGDRLRHFVRVEFLVGCTCCDSSHYTSAGRDRGELSSTGLHESQVTKHEGEDKYY